MRFNYSGTRKNIDACAHCYLFNLDRLLAISSSDLGNDVGNQKTPYINAGIGIGLVLREIGREI